MAVITETSLRAMHKQGIPNPFLLEKGDKMTPAAADYLKGRGIQVKAFDEHQQPSTDQAAEAISEIPIGVSNRHVHLSPEDVERLFGEGHQLTPMRELSQPGQFACQETVTLVGPKGSIHGVRILGPARGATQVEISRTDGFSLGVHAPVRMSGDIEGTPGMVLVTAKGTVVLTKGVIVAKRHVHMSVEEAELYQVKDGDTLILETQTDRPILYPDVVVRVNPRFALDFHVDLDEGNAANLKTGDRVKVIGKNGQLYSGYRR
ncbi:phosphate propanoyltransferase [Brevibacillus choshinensis]|uniref:phosphate propanoyltransferase n=1 Tax=Brevibacillus choshinensis TaxID=54911 RepID=UPI002E1B156A|nr:phosphate propanoyltransferase [Brevibacillus choshinensis]MED4583694.1 phosphate propanoyltransferase [Brevibacillus choshinensis]MED4751598.1 phosphate propanoyltransferase [Brevibacillus choshinensis]